MKLQVIQFSDGYLVKGLGSGYLVNDLPPESTKDYNWVVVKEKPAKVSAPQPRKPVSVIFKLDNTHLQSEFLPLQVGAIYDGALLKWVIEPKYSKYVDLYSAENIYGPTEYKDVPFELEIIADVKRSIYDRPLNVYNGHTIQNYIDDKCFLEEPLLAYRPCYLSSKDLLLILREYVKRNIDPRYAKVVSDYDFHFKVDKLICLTEQEAFQADVSGWKAKKPKYETRYRDTRNLTILNWSTESKWGPVIPEMKANSYEELRAKLDDFLQKAITKINEPLHDCPKCKGRGVLNIN